MIKWLNIQKSKKKKRKNNDENSKNVVSMKIRWNPIDWVSSFRFTDVSPKISKKYPINQIKESMHSSKIMHKTVYRHLHLTE